MVARALLQRRCQLTVLERVVGGSEKVTEQLARAERCRADLDEPQPRCVREASPATQPQTSQRAGVHGRGSRPLVSWTYGCSPSTPASETKWPATVLSRTSTIGVGPGSPMRASFDADRRVERGVRLVGPDRDAEPHRPHRARAAGMRSTACETLRSCAIFVPGENADQHGRTDRDPDGREERARRAPPHPPNASATTYSADLTPWPSGAGSRPSSTGCRRSSSSTSSTSGCASGRRRSSRSSSLRHALNRDHVPVLRAASTAIAAIAASARSTPSPAGRERGSPPSPISNTNRSAAELARLAVAASTARGGTPGRVGEGERRGGTCARPGPGGTPPTRQAQRPAREARARRARPTRAAGEPMSSCAHSGISVLTKSCRRSRGAGAGARRPAGTRSRRQRTDQLAAVVNTG